jgi:peptide/nickel transport system permease protein
MNQEKQEGELDIRFLERIGSAVVAFLLQLLLAIPVFALAIILMLIFGIWLKWLPISGYVAYNENFLLFLRSLILPSLAISLPSIAMVIRYLLTSLREQSGFAYARTARSKGLAEEQILKRHLLRNALLPVLTILGVILINTLGGSIVVEAAFGIPGIGQLLNTGIRNHDLPLVQGLSFYIALIVTCGYLVLDLLYIIVDPRISS